MPVGRGGQRLHARPRPIDAGVKDRPRLAARRRVVRREHVDSELRIRRAPEIAEAPLLEQRLEREGNAGRASKLLGGGDGAGQVARHDVGDAVVSEAARQPLGLHDAASRERVVGALDDARGIALRLAVTDQKDRHHTRSTYRPFQRCGSGSRPRANRARTSPTAGARAKPCPENPAATKRPSTPDTGPMMGKPSGMNASMPTQLWVTVRRWSGV